MEVPSKPVVQAVLKLLLADSAATPSDSYLTDEGSQTSPQTINTVDDQLAALTDAMQSLTTSTVYLRRLHKTFSPIHKLPFELLLQVLRHALPYPLWDRPGYGDPPYNKRVGYFPRLYAYARISSRIRDVIMGCGELWAHVDNRYPASVWRAAITKAQTHPLTVFLERDELPRCRHLVEGTRKKFFAAAFRTVSRWESAELEVDQFEHKNLAALEHHGAPYLASLHINVYDSGDPHTPQGWRKVRLFCGEAQRLRHLRLTCVNFDFASLDLTHLRSLSLEKSSQTTVHALVGVLRGCPNLMSLEFTRDGLQVESQEVAQEALHLPELESITLRVNGVAMEHILTLLQIPNCRSYKISPTKPSGTIAQSFLSGPRSGLVQRSVATSSRLDITLDYSSISIISYDSKEGSGAGTQVMEVTASLPIMAVMDWLASILRSAPSNLHIALSIGYFSTGDLRDRDKLHILWSLPGLTSLALKGGAQVDSILKALSDPVTTKDGRSAWLCPKLHPLTLCDVYYCEKYWEDGSILLSLVRNRFEAKGGDWDGDGGDGGSPASFRHFKVTGASCTMEQEVCQKIVDILGEAAEWNQSGGIYRDEDDDMAPGDPPDESIALQAIVDELQREDRLSDFPVVQPLD